MINWFDKKMQLPDISFYERCKHMSWCLKNDITINLVIESWNNCFLRINDKGKITDHCNQYGYVIKYKQNKLRPSDKLWSKDLYELYSEYYIKYNPEFIPLKQIKRNEQKKQLRAKQGFID